MAPSVWILIQFYFHSKDCFRFFDFVLIWIWIPYGSEIQSTIHYVFYLCLKTANIIIFYYCQCLPNFAGTKTPLHRLVLTALFLPFLWCTWLHESLPHDGLAAVQLLCCTPFINQRNRNSSTHRTNCLHFQSCTSSLWSKLVVTGKGSGWLNDAASKPSLLQDSGLEAAAFGLSQAMSKTLPPLCHLSAGSFRHGPQSKPAEVWLSASAGSQEQDFAD